MKKLTARLATLTVGLAITAGARANSVYPLNGSYADNDGSGPALVPDSGTLTTTGYQFGANQGLHVSNVLADTGNYSIDLVFRLDDTSGFRKLIDFADRSVDTGLYVHNGSLEFYNKPSLPTVTIAPSQLNTILLTRDAATKIVSGYVNGLQQFAFSDTTNIAVFSGTNGIMRFFEDDTATGGSEASGGFVDRIRIADNAQGQFGSAAATPLPTAGIAGLTLLGGLGLTRGRRQSAPTHR